MGEMVNDLAGLTTGAEYKVAISFSLRDSILVPGAKEGDI